MDKLNSQEPVCIVCPILYGSVASWLGKKADEASTHKWTVYVRGPSGEDLSCFVSEVCFTLHPSFAEPVRVIKTAPFEVTENGWGEFEVGIRIIFHDNNEQPIDLKHNLKLYSSPNDKSPNLKKPVIAETYDEIVFTNPRDDFFRKLMLYKQQKIPEVISQPKENSLPLDDQSDVQQLSYIENTLLQDIETCKSRLFQLDNELYRLQRTGAINLSISEAGLDKRQFPS